MVPTATNQPKMPTKSTPELNAVASNLAPLPTSCCRTRPIVLEEFVPLTDLDGPDRPHERPRLKHQAGCRARLECVVQATVTRLPGTEPSNCRFFDSAFEPSALLQIFPCGLLDGLPIQQKM
jgi:hypothetical protein